MLPGNAGSCTMSAPAKALLLITSLSRGVRASIVFNDRPALLAARDSWCSDPEAASIHHGSISEWDVSAIDDISSLFCACVTPWCLDNRPDCNGNCSTFNGDISTWDVSRVTNMNDLFQQARAFNHPLNAWDTSRVTSIWGTFYDASSFNQPLAGWDTKRVTTLRMAFRDATSFNQPLATWDTSRMTSLLWTFRGATSFNQPLAWNVTQVVKMDELFTNTPALSECNRAKIYSIFSTNSHWPYPEWRNYTSCDEILPGAGIYGFESLLPMLAASVFVFVGLPLWVCQRNQVFLWRPPQQKEVILKASLASS